MKKGLRVLLCLFFSIFSLIMCISFNLNTTKENLENSQANIVGYVEPKNDLVIKNKVNIEVNTKLPNIKEYFTKYNLNDTGVIKYYINDKEINKKDVISNVNTYKVVIIVNKNKYNTELNVIDTKSPKLTTKNITIYENEKYNINSFVTSCKDNSNKKCNISFANKKMANYTKSGTYKISISAKDNSNNETISNATLTIKNKITSNKTSNNSNKKSNKSATTTKKTNNTSNSKYKTTYELQGLATKEVKNNKKIADEVIKYTNSYRKEVNAKALKYDEKLSIVATIRVIEIAYYDKFDHVRPNGLTFSSVIRDLNINYGYCGENIAYGYIDSEEVSVAWKESKGHYKNMVNTQYTKIGVGYYEYNNTIYWAQIFTD